MTSFNPSPSHLHPLDFDLSNLSSLTSTQLSLVQYHVDFDTLSPTLTLQIYKEWSQRRERSRSRSLASSKGAEELHEIDLSFELTDLNTLSSDQLAVVQFHPECTEMVQLRSEMTWRGRRERDFSKGLVWEEKQHRQVVEGVDGGEDLPSRLRERDTTDGGEVLPLGSHGITDGPVLEEEITQQTEMLPGVAELQPEERRPLIDLIELPSIEDVVREQIEFEGEGTPPREEEMEIDEEELSIRDVTMEGVVAPIHASLIPTSAISPLDEVHGITSTLPPSPSAIQPTPDAQPSKRSSNPLISTPPPPSNSDPNPPSKTRSPSPIPDQLPDPIRSPSASPELIILVTPFPLPRAASLPAPSVTLLPLPLPLKAAPVPLPLPPRPWGSTPLTPQFTSLIYSLRISNLPSSEIFQSTNLLPLFPLHLQPIASILLPRLQREKEILRSGYVGFESFEQRTLAFQAVLGKRLLGGNRLIGVEFCEEVRWEWKDLSWGWAEGVWRREILKEREEKEEERRKVELALRASVQKEMDALFQIEAEVEVEVDTESSANIEAQVEDEEQPEGQVEAEVELEAVIPAESDMEIESEGEANVIEQNQGLPLPAKDLSSSLYDGSLHSIPPVLPTSIDTTPPLPVPTLVLNEGLIPMSILSTFSQLYISFKTLPEKLERRTVGNFLSLPFVLGIKAVGPLDPQFRKFYILFQSQTIMLKAWTVLKSRHSDLVTNHRMKIKFKSSEAWTLNMFTKKMRQVLRLSMKSIPLSEEEQEPGRFPPPAASKGLIMGKVQRDKEAEAAEIAQAVVTPSVPSAFSPNPMILAPFPSAFIPSPPSTSAISPSLPSLTTPLTSLEPEARFDPTRDQDSRLLPSGWSRCWSKTHKTWYFLDAKDVSSWTNPLTLTNKVAVLENEGRASSSSSAQHSRIVGRKTTADQSSAADLLRNPLPYSASTSFAPFTPSSTWTPEAAALDSWYPGGMPWYPGIWDDDVIDFSPGASGGWREPEDEHSASNSASTSEGNSPNTPFANPAPSRPSAPVLPVEAILRPFPSGHWGKSAKPRTARLSYPLPNRPPFDPPSLLHSAPHFSNHSHQWHEATTNAFGSTPASGSTSVPADYYPAETGNPNGRMGHSGPVVGGKNKRRQSGQVNRSPKKNRKV